MCGKVYFLFLIIIVGRLLIIFVLIFWIFGLMINGNILVLVGDVIFDLGVDCYDRVLNDL